MVTKDIIYMAFMTYLTLKVQHSIRLGISLKNRKKLRPNKVILSHKSVLLLRKNSRKRGNLISI